ncbi:MAG: hypothetical protein RBU45_16230 [Myxococcota bacterium]|jgi:hypothetical protein|nr:hypothetical protein [Myxococcota bacterium]
MAPVLADVTSPAPAPRPSRSPGWLAGAAFFGGSLLVYLGQRVVAGGTARPVLTVGGLLLLLLALGLRARGLRSSRGPARLAERVLLAATGGGTLAALLGVAATGSALAAWGPADEVLRTRLEVVLQVAWVILWVVSAAVLLFVERAYGPMRRVGRAERGRVLDALRAGSEVSLAAALLVVLNYLATVHDPVADLSYFRTARPGEATRKLVGSLVEPVDALLFFPAVNEVSEQVLGYLRPLQSFSPQLRVRRVDRLLSPAEAQRFEVRSDGTLVLARGPRFEKLLLGEELAPARSKLRKLDGEFQQRLLRVLQAERTAYLVTGHRERGSEDREQGKVPGIRVLREILEVVGYRVEELGLAQGLGSGVPADAGLVVLLGPREELLPEEVATLTTWFRTGGRLLLALDPEGGAAHASLLAAFGLRFDPTPLVADQNFLRQRYSPADGLNLVTDRLSGHAAVASFGRLAQRAAVILPGAGSLQRHGAPSEALRVDLPVTSLPEVWKDLDGSFTLSGSERRGEHALLAAVVHQPAEPAAPPPGAAPGTAASAPAAPEGRAAVLADADGLTDAVMGNPGNQLLAADLLRWLGGQEAFAGLIESEQDVPVQHTRRGNAAWFYGTVFLPPALVLGLGLLISRRRRPR